MCDWRLKVARKVFHMVEDKDAVGRLSNEALWGFYDVGDIYHRHRFCFSDPSEKQQLMTTASAFHASPAPSGMICTITETTLNKDFNDVLGVANGAVKVLAADVVRYWHWLQGVQVYLRDIT
jgi:hypothetical protein